MGENALLDINLHASQASRGLVKYVSKRGTHIWYFPPDYEDRIVDTIDQLLNQ
jgi:hypothetical protein